MYSKLLIMLYKKFGKLDWNISLLGLGCMRLPGKKVLFWKLADETKAVEMIRYAIDSGINYIDTAYSYHAGKSEIIVGKALKNGYREKVKLVTKLPIWKVKKAEDFDRLLNEQLKKLDVPYLDLYLFHALNKDRFELIKKLDLIKKMEQAKEKGLIKAIGFSFHDSFKVFKEIVDYYPWDACLVQHNYVDADIQATSEGIKYAHSKGLAVVIMEPLKGGRLANPSEEILKIMEKSPVKRTPPDWALQFLFNKPEINVVISGMGSKQMVDENIKSVESFQKQPLTEEEKKILDEITKVFKKNIVIPCSGCNYCQPCPSGVAIPRIFSMVNDVYSTKNLKKYQKAYQKLTKEKLKLNADKTNGNAELCVKCRKCVNECPQGIDIPTELQKAHDLLTGKK